MPEFFVALEKEGYAARDLAPDADIYVLNGLPAGAARKFCGSRFAPLFDFFEQIAEWQNYCRAHGAHPACVFVDTGFNRLGLDEAEVQTLAGDPSLFEDWTLTLVASHLACADDTEHPMNRAQLEKFRFARDLLPDAPASLANSGGVLLGPITALI